MQPSLSPKKYIETKVRSLPVYKCLVNKDWEEAQMANVVVMRRHSNGHITAGVYLVDLLCLGVKDTMYFFNVPEQELEEDLGLVRGLFKEIDYDLAHNIVYAGHDYAMDFDIHPYKDFALTRFILEEDNDTVPLIEIPVGTEDGKPHLMVYQHGEFSDALAKLKRNAGEGNYYYSVGEDEEWDEDETAEYDELTLDEISPGSLGFSDAELLSDEELDDVGKIEQRTVLERVIIHAERLTRLLPAEQTSLIMEDEREWEQEWDLIDFAVELPNNVKPQQDEENKHVLAEIAVLSASLDEEEEADRAVEKKLLEELTAHSSNPLLVINMLQLGEVFKLPGLSKTAREFAEAIHQQFPSVLLTLALEALLEGGRDARFAPIYEYKDLKTALPGYEAFSDLELTIFWLIRLWLSLEAKSKKDIMNYYTFIKAVDMPMFFMIPVFLKMSKQLMADLSGKGEA